MNYPPQNILPMTDRSDPAPTTDGFGFEVAVCPRCVGTGRARPQMISDPCRKCVGIGYAYTKRGAAAKRFYDSLLKIPASSLKPGHRVNAWLRGVSTAITVTGVEPHPSNPNWLTVRIAEDDIPYNYHADDWVRVYHTNEQKAWRVKAALRYQDLLIKSGKPSMRTLNQFEVVVTIARDRHHDEHKAKNVEEANAGV